MKRLYRSTVLFALRVVITAYDRIAEPPKPTEPEPRVIDVPAVAAVVERAELAMREGMVIHGHGEWDDLDPNLREALIDGAIIGAGHCLSYLREQGVDLSEVA